MKKTIFTLAVAIMLMAGTIFTGCQSSDAKIKDAQANVQDAKQDLKEVQKDADVQAHKYANAEELETFKRETEVKIKDNETRIAEFREKMKNSGKTLDAIRAKRIDELEQKNRDLRTRMDVYEKSQSDWESFKREFNHDLDALGQGFKELAVDNKK